MKKIPFQNIISSKGQYVNSEIKLTLAGVPNVGKSTLFNALTGMKQHTGNWVGKTVECASGEFSKGSVRFFVTDIPGTYSLYTHSAEETRAREQITEGDADITVVLCDASCPERSLVLALQILEITDRLIVFFNLSDEAEKLGITIDTKTLQKLLGIPVLCGTAKNKRDVSRLIELCIETVKSRDANSEKAVYKTKYPEKTEKTVALLEAEGYRRSTAANTVYNSPEDFALNGEETRDGMAKAFVFACDDLCKKAVTRTKGFRLKRDEVLDRLFTGKYTAFPLMALLLIFIFWLTVRGANYPSNALWYLFGNIGEKLSLLLEYIGCPDRLSSFLTDGVYRVTSWIVSVMLPPMAIFFPLFTLLEDLGYLPRLAFNLDRCFKNCGGCGKQALCMCMGLGCNAVGVTGCRIIDSRRERLLALVTNSMVPCNGKFPAILTVCAVFFTFSEAGSSVKSLMSAAVLFLILVLSTTVTLISSKFLSKTVLKGMPSSFTLELVPYRVPQVAKTLVRSILDRTVFVLGRAVAAAIPAGALIWLLANINVNGSSLFSYISTFLEPVGSILGLDGVILTAFILGLPANETVLPIALMGYLSTGALPENDTVHFVSEVLLSNGWTLTTAICTVVFSLFHFPCATTLLTIKKETGSLKWTLFSAAFPTVIGTALCIAINLISNAVSYFL